MFTWCGSTTRQDKLIYPWSLNIEGCKEMYVRALLRHSIMWYHMIFSGATSRVKCEWHSRPGCVETPPRWLAGWLIAHKLFAEPPTFCRLQNIILSPRVPISPDLMTIPPWKQQIHRRYKPIYLIFLITIDRGCLLYTHIFDLLCRSTGFLSILRWHHPPRCWDARADHSIHNAPKLSGVSPHLEIHTGHQSVICKQLLHTDPIRYRLSSPLCPETPAPQTRLSQRNSHRLLNRHCKSKDKVKAIRMWVCEKGRRRGRNLLQPHPPQIRHKRKSPEENYGQERQLWSWRPSRLSNFVSSCHSRTPNLFEWVWRIGDVLGSPTISNMLKNLELSTKLLNKTEWKFWLIVRLCSA